MTSVPSQPVDEAATDPFVLYSRSLYDYTFLLWQESKRVVDENTRAEPAETGKEKKRVEDDQPTIKQSGE